ncbi:MAG TPA: tetratricopeptide repeat protein, partial [bacterium]|nr:tetratricopeptide repeat protein [bacterium]
AFKAQDFGVAAGALKKATQLKPKDAEAWELYGTVLAAQKKGDAAAAALRTAVQLDGSRGQAWQQLALLRSAAGGKDAWAEAAKAWGQAAKLKPEDGRLRLNQGLLLAKLGQTDDAVAALEKASGLDNGGGAWRTLCVLYNKEGKSAKAAEACAKAADGGAGAESWYNLGYAEQRLGQAQKARSAFAKALDAEPRHAPSLYAMAFLDFQAGDAEKALAGFKAALKARDGDYPEAQYNAAVLLSDQGRYEESAGMYRDLLKRHPDDADAKAALAAAVEAGTAGLLGDGRDAYERGDFDAARKAWQRALALDPDNQEAQRLLKQAHAKTTQAADAAAAARKAAHARVAERLKAQDAVVLKQGQEALRAGRLGEAVRLLDFYLKKNPKDEAARLSLTKARAQLRGQVEDRLSDAAAELAGGDRGQARRSAQEALDLDPQNVRASELLAKAGEAPAKPKVDHDSLRKLYYAGVEQYLQGDLAGAVATWKKVLASDPEQLDAKRSLAQAELELEALRKRGKG